MIRHLEALLALAERVLEWLVALLVFGLLVIVASQLVDRHFVTLPMAAPDQYARVMLVWLTFIGFALAVKGGVNVRVDIIDAHLPPRIRLALEYVFDVAMLILTVLAAWHGWPLVGIGLDQERLGTVLSEAWPAAALLLSTLMLALFLLLRILVRLSGREPPRAHAAD